MIITDRITRRFWPKIRKQGPEDCWLWIGATYEHGYGQLWDGASAVSKKYLMPHRIAFFIANPTAPHYTQVMHLCHKKLCCNPAHLRGLDEKDHRLYDSLTKEARKDNSSGHTGVCFDRTRNMWIAQAHKDRKHIHLYFGPDFQEALKARQQWENTERERLQQTVNITQALQENT